MVSLEKKKILKLISSKLNWKQWEGMNNKESSKRNKVENIKHKRKSMKPNTGFSKENQ